MIDKIRWGILGTAKEFSNGHSSFACGILLNNMEVIDEVFPSAKTGQWEEIN